MIIHVFNDLTLVDAQVSCLTHPHIPPMPLVHSDVDLSCAMMRLKPKELLSFSHQSHCSHPHQNLPPHLCSSLYPNEDSQLLNELLTRLQVVSKETLINPFLERYCELLNDLELVFKEFSVIRSVAILVAKQEFKMVIAKLGKLQEE